MNSKVKDHKKKRCREVTQAEQYLPVGVIVSLRCSNPRRRTPPPPAIDNTVLPFLPLLLLPMFRAAIRSDAAAVSAADAAAFVPKAEDVTYEKDWTDTKE